MDDQQDDNQGIVAWVLGIAVTIAVATALILGIGAAMQGGGGGKPAPTAASAEVVEVETPPALATGPGVPVLVNFYFETGLADLPSDATVQVQALVEYAKSSPNTKIGVSGFHDKHGDPQANQELAKRRAKATREMLIVAGVPEDRIILVKPQESTGGPDDRHARRVDIYPAQ